MKKNQIIALSLIMLYSLSSATFAALAKLLSADIKPVQILFSSYLVSFTLLLLVIFKRKRAFTIKSRAPVLQLLKAIFGLSQLSLSLLAYNCMPITNALVLRNTSPLWVPLLAYFFLKNDEQKTQWFAISLGFCGVIILVHPHFNNFNLGLIFALVSGIAMAANAITARMLNVRSEPATRTLFYTLLFPVFVLFFLSFNSWGRMQWHTVLLLLLAGIALFTTIFAFIKAYRYASAVFITPFTYSVLVFSAFYDWYIWQERITIYVLLGAGLIIVGCTLNLRYIVKNRRINNKLIVSEEYHG